MEVLFYGAVAAASGALDLGTTRLFWAMGNSPWLAKSLASVAGLIFNFLGRRFVVFPEAARRTRTSAPERVLTGSMAQAQLDSVSPRSR